VGSVIKSHDLSILILHGWKNHQPHDHWQYWLAGKLTAAGHHVEYPQLPKPDHPDLEDWSEAVMEAAGRLDTRERVVVCHSLGCLAWLYAVSQVGPKGFASSAPGADEAWYRVALVAPPGRPFLRASTELSSFNPDVWPESLASPVNPAAPRIRETLLVRSDGDPYCPVPEDVALPHVENLRGEFVPGQGHFDLDAGYGSWPGMLAWCEGRQAEIGPRQSTDEAIGTPPAW